MTAPLTAGARLRSAVCTTEVVVIRADDPAARIECGGVAMTPVSVSAPTIGEGPRSGYDAGSVLGKRYGDAGDPVELLCTKPGAGSLSVGEHLLAERRAKPLPASD
jgi:hypothetical protein